MNTKMTQALQMATFTGMRARTWKMVLEFTLSLMGLVPEGWTVTPKMVICNHSGNVYYAFNFANENGDHVAQVCSESYQTAKENAMAFAQTTAHMLVGMKRVPGGWVRQM